MRYTTLKYATAGRIARITLNRPARPDAIDDRMPGKYAEKHGFHEAVKGRDSGKAIP